MPIEFLSFFLSWTIYKTFYYLPFLFVVKYLESVMFVALQACKQVSNQWTIGLNK